MLRQHQPVFVRKRQHEVEHEYNMRLSHNKNKGVRALRGYFCPL